MRDNYMDLPMEELYEEIEWTHRLLALSERALKASDFFQSQTLRIANDLAILEARYAELTRNSTAMSSPSSDVSQ